MTTPLVPFGPIFPTNTTFVDESAEAVLPAMAMKRTAEPTELLISLEDAYQQLRLDTSLGVSPPSRPDDPLIESAVLAATEEIDGIEAWLGRALVTQSWEFSLFRFPRGPILLPLPPLQTVESVKYLDTAGTRQTLVANVDYRVGTEGRIGYVAPLWRKSWPQAREQSGSVVIAYTCGYGGADDVPKLIKQYAKMRLGFYYENRETTVLERGVNVQGEFGFLAGALENLRVRGVFKP